MADGGKAGGGGMKLPSRSTRGNRMGALLNQARDEAADEGDDEFWGQAAFAEEERDEEYVSEAEEADQFDSDFSESEDEDDGDDGGDDEPRRKAALRPPGEAKARPKKPPGALKGDAKPRALAALEGLVAGADGEGADAQAHHRQKAPRPTLELTAEMQRKSKRSTVLELGVMRERAAAEAAAKPKPKVRRVVEERPLTQEEMLAEAVTTEALNQESLQRILAMEEESKKRMTVVKEDYAGPIVRFRSRRADGEALVFLNGATLDGAPRKATGYPTRRKCAFTGRRARFRDPVTKQAYVDKAAFTAIRAAAAAGTLQNLPFYVRPPQPAPTEGGWGSFRGPHLGAF